MPILQRPIRLKRAEEVRTSWCEIIPPGIDIETVLKADYWEHVHGRFTVYDTIEIIAVDGSYEVVARIVMIAPGVLKFRILAHWFPAVDEAAEPIRKQGADAFFTQLDERSKTWTVVQRDGGKAIVKGLDKETAEKERLRLEAERMAA